MIQWILFILPIFFIQKKQKIEKYLLFIILFELLVSIILQFFGIFNQVNLIITHIIIYLGIYIWKKPKLNINFRYKDIDLILIIVIIIAALSLYMPHNNYNGSYNIATTSDYQVADDMEYTYPYFTDEWYAIGFIKDSINTGFLPFRNPVWSNAPFFNVQFPFHSTLSSFVLLLNLNPLTDYIWLSFASGIILISLSYLLLRKYNVNKLPAAISSLSLLYISQAGHLSGIWNLMPITLGLISLLLCFFYIDNKNLFIISSILTLLFYPPLILFLSLLILYQSQQGFIKKQFLILYGSIVLVTGLLLSLALVLYSPSAFIDFVFGKLLYKVPRDLFQFHYPLHEIIPLHVIIFGIIGLYPSYKKQRWLVWSAVIGLLFWLLYSFTDYRILIGWQRIIFVTSCFVVLLAGFGLDWIVKYINNNLRKKKKPKNNLLHIATKSILWISLGVFFILIPFYTQMTGWQNLEIISQHNYTQAPPAHQYLKQEDLKIFSNINNSIFVSIPWKGTVLGVATDNYPLDVKGGTVYLQTGGFYQDLMNANCTRKKEMVERYKVDYLYIPKVECNLGQIKAISDEGLVLYKVSE